MSTSKPQESLAVHPLLNTSVDNAKYIPYTPRQRQPAPPSAPLKPQLANLRTATQSIGLDTNTVGWAILEKISYEGDTSDEWSEIWNALTKARVRLVVVPLPLLIVHRQRCSSPLNRVLAMTRSPQSLFRTTSSFAILRPETTPP